MRRPSWSLTTGKEATTAPAAAVTASFSKSRRLNLQPPSFFSGLNTWGSSSPPGSCRLSLFSIFSLPIRLTQYNGRSSWLQNNQCASNLLISHQDIEAFDDPTVSLWFSTRTQNTTDSNSCAVSLIDLYRLFPDVVPLICKREIDDVSCEANQIQAAMPAHFK
jgi:hypothetical protein